MHSTENEALWTMAIIRGRPRVHERDNMEQRVYRCEFCGQWHTTSQDFDPTRRSQDKEVV